MKLYSGIDLHSNNHVLTIIDETDHKVLERRLPNKLDATLQCLAPYKQNLTGIAVESTYNWYWLVDALMDAGYRLHLINTTAVKQYGGKKFTNDQHDAFHLATCCVWVSCRPAISIPRRNGRFATCCASAACWSGIKPPTP